MAQAPLSSFEPMIPQIADLLADDDQLTAFFNGLTIGYQREWARYVFGAKASATQQRHIADMRLILAAGYKSKLGARPPFGLSRPSHRVPVQIWRTVRQQFLTMSDPLLVVSGIVGVSVLSTFS